MDSVEETNLKTAICAMVERLDDGVRRLEMASEQSANGTSELELVRQEWRELTKQSMHHLSNVACSLEPLRHNQSRCLFW